MLVLLLVAAAFAAPAAKNDALARLQAAIGGAVALEHHKNMLSSVIGDQEYIVEPRRAASGNHSSLRGSRRPNENEVNEPISEYLYQGDIMLTAADMARMTAESGSIRSKRGAPNVLSKRFNKNQPIGFVFSSEIPDESRKLIRETLAKITSNTCITFKENYAVGTQIKFLRGGGCWSVVGEQADPRYSGYHPISIEELCERPGSISHEVFHALGLDHTHTRKDRDSFVTVKSELIYPGKEHNFKKLSDAENNNFGVPYEYGSALHYYPTDFTTVEGKPVLVLKYKDYENTIGQRDEATYDDFRLVNALYSCSAQCSKQMVCQNGGYPSPKDCNACVCPEFYTGATCQTPRNLLALTASTPSLKSTFHQDQNNAIFGKKEKSLYGRDAPRVITAPAGRKIRVTLSQISLNNGKMKSCPGHASEIAGIEIRDAPGGDLTTLGKLFHCPTLEGYSFVSQSNVVGYKAYIQPGMNTDITVTYTLV